MTVPDGVTAIPAHDDPDTLFWIVEAKGQDSQTIHLLRDSYGGVRPATRPEVAFWMKTVYEYTTNAAGQRP